MNFEISTEADLEGLLGQYETIRLDFKSSRLLAADKSKPQIIEDLSREVSAFANTEGGMLVIGIEPGKEAEKAMGVSLSEGVDPNLRKPEWLQQVVASNISPPLNGLIVRPIPLTAARHGKVAYVIVVPKGETAYQASDMRYYGRHELESKPLADNEIRLRMNRGRTAHAFMSIASISCLYAVDEFRARMEQVAGIQSELNAEGFIPPARRRGLSEELSVLSLPQRTFDEYVFELEITNDGPVTIRDCSLLLADHQGAGIEVTPAAEKEHWIFEFLPEYKYPDSITYPARRSEAIPVREKKIFPQQTVPFPGAALTMRVPCGALPDPWSIQWTLYLENAPSTSGVLDFAKAVSAL